MGQALLHLPEKERGDRHPAKGRVRALVLQRRLAKGPQAHPPKDRRAYAVCWIKFTSPKEISALQPTLRNYIYQATQVEESGKQVPLKGGSGVCGSRGVASQAECGSRAESGVRSPNAGTEEVVRPSCLGREGGEDAGSAGGEVCANDLN